MSKELLGDRRKALDESFFAKQNEALRQRLQETERTKVKKDALSTASDITDHVVLEKLAALNIGIETLPTLSLVPLVAVAWADGSIDDNERSAILLFAAEVGLSPQDENYQVVERWLAEQPSSKLLATWKDYIGTLSGTLNSEAKYALKVEVLDRARAVAKAAGGFLGIGQRVSTKEIAVLEELERAFA